MTEGIDLPDPAKDQALVASAYLAFIEQARENIAERIPDASMDANRTILSLNRTSQAVTYDLESTLLRPRGLSWSVYRLLFVLWNAGDLEPTRLAELTGTTRASVSNLVKPLVADGLLERRPSPHDRRAAVISLADKGRSIIEEAFADVNRREAEWDRILTPIERDLLVALLQKLLLGGRQIGARVKYEPH